MSSLPSVQSFENDLNRRYANYSVSSMEAAGPGSGRIESCFDAPLEIAEISARRIIAVRDPLPAALRDRVHVLLCLDGAVQVHHCGQRADLVSGDILVLDSAEGCVIRVAEEHRARTIELRRDRLERWAVPVDLIVGTRIAGDAGLSRHLVNLVSGIDPTATLPRLYADALQDVCSHMLAHCIPDAASFDDGNRRVAVAELERMARWVRSELEDGNPVTPDRLATRFGLSRRNLYRLFSRGGHTPNAWLLQIRLELGRHLLTMGASRSGLVADIAYRCDFSDAAHFSRLFKKRYGVSPNEFRQTYALPVRMLN